MLTPSLRTPKACFFCVEVVKGRLGSCYTAAQLLGQGHVMEDPFSVGWLFLSLKGLSEILL